jgi:uncharacterized membrane protein (DUF106 family)
MMAAASFVGSFLGSLTELYLAFKSMQEMNKKMKQAQQTKTPATKQQPATTISSVPEEKDATSSKTAA